MFKTDALGRSVIIHFLRCAESLRFTGKAWRSVDIDRDGDGYSIKELYFRTNIIGESRTRIEMAATGLGNQWIY